MIYKITGIVSVSCYTEVEADTPEEALRIAMRRPLADIHIDGGNDVTECFHIDNDGEPTQLRIEEE